MRQLLLFTCSLLLSSLLTGQVRGVSYTIAPSASYNWFGDESGLDDAFMFGGRLGFGFGEYVELRATYMQTLDLDTDFDALGIGIDSTFGNQGVDLRRYGAELKLNIGRGSLLPYLVLGGGIQDTERDGLELDNSENIFGTLGLGLTLSAADRYAFGVEGKYIAYSGNTVRNLLDEAERQSQGLDVNAFDSDNIGSFAVAANLQFYLGGRRPGQLSDIDEEYLRNFQGGLTGLSLPVELGLAQVNWDDALNYRDAYFAGGTAGFSFGPLVSLRGFYYRGMTEEDLNFDFDDIALYGADFRFNLTQASSGLVPYLNVGGGYIDLGSDYNANITEGSELASSQGFASGGGGIYLKLGERLLINGGARALLTTGADLADLESTEQLTTSYMYNAGLGFTLGGNNRRNPRVVRQETMEDRLEEQEAEFDRRSDSLRVANQQEVNRLRTRYQDSLARLDQELILALEDGDTITAEEIKVERAGAAAIVDELDARNAQLDDQVKREERAEIDAVLGRPVQPTARLRPADSLPAATVSPTGQNGSVIVLQADQIDKLIDAFGNRGGNSASQPAEATGEGSRLDQIDRRIERMEDMMFQMNMGPRPAARGDRREPRDTDERIEQMEARLERMRDNNDDDRASGSADQQRIQELEREVESMRLATGNRSDATTSAGQSGGGDNGDLQQRIDDLERQLAEAREEDGDDDDESRRERRARNRDDDRRMKELEERLSDRMDNLRSSDDDEETEKIRQEMVRDMSDYQSELMEEITDLRRDLDRANRELARREAIDGVAEDRADLERDRLRQERRAARLAAATTTTFDTAGNKVILPGTRSLDEIEINSGGVYLADGNAEGFFSNFTYTGMSGTVGFNFGDATGLGLGLRWHYKLGPDQRMEFMPEAYFGIGSPTTFGIFGNLVYPIITERSQSTGLIPYAGLGIGALQIKDKDDSSEVNFRPAINLIVGTYLPVGNGRVFVDFSTRNFFSVNQLTGGYRFNF